MQSIISRQFTPPKGAEMTEYLAPNGKWVLNKEDAENLPEGLAKAKIRILKREHPHFTFDHLNL